MNATCSFCGTNSHPEEQLVGAATKGVYICKDCAQLCCDILDAPGKLYLRCSDCDPEFECFPGVVACIRRPIAGDAEAGPSVEELGAKFQSAGGDKVRALVWHKCDRCKGYWFDAGGETWLPRQAIQRLVGALREIERETSRSVDVDQPPGRKQLTCWTEIAREALQAPPDYKCSECGVHGVKLWRQSGTFVDDIKLKCAVCAVADQIIKCSKHAPRSADEIGDDGRWKGKHNPTDKIGGLVPAVPSENSFWGYTSVPQEGVDWWRRLPTHKERHGER